jgi:hypothetical protein
MNASGALSVCAFLLCDLLVTFVPAAAAQAPSAPTAARMELSVGAGFLNGAGLGSADADLRGRSDQPFRLFDASSRIGRSVPMEVRLGFPIGPRYVFEIRGAWARPELQTSISADVEGAPPLTLMERVDQYSLDLGLLVNLRQARPRSLLPFVSGGAGYVGAVHEGLSLLENGMSFRGGGGVKYPLTVQRGGRIKAVGLRADAALIVLTRGLVGETATSQVSTSGSLYLSF